MDLQPKTILVAEDEDIVRALAADVFKEAGFRVLEAEHSASALVHLEREPQSIHLLFTDVHMPGEVDGLGLIAHSYRCWPWVALIVTSGNAVPNTRDLPMGCRFVPKPYDLDEVVAHARKMVNICEN